MFSFVTLCSWTLQNTIYMRGKKWNICFSYSLTNCDVKKANRCKTSRVWHNPTLNGGKCAISISFKKTKLRNPHFAQITAPGSHWAPTLEEQDLSFSVYSRVAVNQNQCPNLFHGREQAWLMNFLKRRAA